MADDPVPDARRNWMAHAIEGGAFMGALALVNTQTLLPSVVKSMGGPEWLVALMPVLMMLGFTLMPVLTAHHVGAPGHFRPLLMWVGLLQRGGRQMAGYRGSSHQRCLPAQRPSRWSKPRT